MKRKLDDSDWGYSENPTKINPLALVECYNGLTTHGAPGATPRSLEPPVQASTPYPSGEGPRRKLISQEVMRTPGLRTPRKSYNVNATTDAELRRVIDNFVQIYEQLDKSDDPNVKPNYSYTELAYLAMLRSPNFCLPIAQIYSYMQGRFKFFRNSSRKHWKNAVRHSLAKTMCFTKIPVGRGTSDQENLARSTYLWCIVPNSLSMFARGDYRTTVDRETGTNTLRSAYFAMNSGQFWDSVGDYVADKMALFRNAVENTSNPGAIFESQTCSVPQKQSFGSGFQPFQQRQPFHNIQNTNTLQHEETVQPTFAPQINTFVAPTQNTGNKVNANMRSCNAQTKSTSQELRMPETYVQNHITVESVKSLQSPTPNVDPWIPSTNVSSLQESFSSVEFERRTPPFTQFDFTDSGFETADGSASDSSCKFSSIDDSRFQATNFASPSSCDQGRSTHIENFDQFDLSPFSLSDFTDMTQSCTGNYQQNTGNYQQKMTPAKHSFSPQMFNVPNIGQPMYMSTPMGAQNLQRNQCRFMLEPVSTIQSCGQNVFAAPMSYSGVPAAPMFVVSGDNIFAMSVLPENGQFFH